MSTFYSEFIETECIKGSGISRSLIEGTTTEIEDTGLWEPNRALGLKVSTQYQTHRPPNLGAIAIFRQETGELWCAKAEHPRTDWKKLKAMGYLSETEAAAAGVKISKIKYEFGKGNELTPYLPPIDAETRRKISQRYGVEVPETGSFWEWIQQHPEIQIVLDEGAKKALSLLSIGIVAIGLNGCWGAYRKEIGLLPELLPYVTGRSIVIAFDQDEKAKTRVDVARAIDKTGPLLAAVAAGVRIAEWEPAQGKGPDDVRVQSGDEAIEDAISEAASFEQWQRANRRASNLERAAATLACTYPAEVTLKKRYLSASDIPTLNPGDMLPVISPVETGKTELLRAIVANHRQRYPNSWIIGKGSLNSLLHQTGQRIGIPHIQQLDRDYNGDIHCAMRMEKAALFCLDSSHRINWDDMPPNPLLLLDEGEATAEHGLSGGTLGDRQNEILSLWRSVCCRVLATGGNIVIAEDSLTDIGLNFYSELVHNAYPLRIVRNDFKHSKKVQLARCGAGAMTGKIFEALAEGKKVAAPTDSQGNCEQIDIAATALGYRVFRLDSKTADTPEAKRFQLDPDKFLAENDFDLVTLSPTAKSGLNIKSPGWHIRASLIASDCRSQFQLLTRFRNPESILVRTAVRAPVSDHAAATTPEAILKNNRLSARITANITGLRTELQSEDWSTEAQQQLERLDTALSESDKEAEFWNRHAAIFQARSNLLRSEVEGNFERYLNERGFEVERVELPKNSEASERIKAAKFAIESETASRLFALPGGQTEAQSISVLSSPSSTHEQRLNAEKSLLQHKYPGAEWSEERLLDMVVADRGKGLKTAVLLWNCQHPEICKKLDRAAFRNQLSKQWVNGSRLTHHTQKATLFEYIELQALIDLVESGKELTEDSPEIQAVKAKAIAEANAIRRLTRLNITPEQTGIHIADKLLRQFGYDLRKSRRIGSRGERHSTFTVVSTYSEEHRQQIFEALNRKWAEDLKDSEKSVSPICNIENTLMQMGDTGTKKPPEPTKSPMPSVGARVRFAADGSECQVQRVENGLVWLRRLDQFVRTAVFTARPEELEAAA